MNCLFCDSERVKKHQIFETETERVICNIRPANKGQCLVIPKRHVKNLRELSDSEIASLFNTIKLVSSKISDYLRPIGFNYGFNEGEYSGQTIEHFHVHILPRFKGDKLPEFHIFHRDPKTKRNLADEETEPYISEFRRLFKYIGR